MLLDALMKRPEQDFRRFAAILCMTNQGHLADLLLPGISSRGQPTILLQGSNHQVNLGINAYEDDKQWVRSR
jgi:hypothetical protein